jgi:hypothetical protein
MKMVSKDLRRWMTRTYVNEVDEGIANIAIVSEI